MGRASASSESRVLWRFTNAALDPRRSLGLAADDMDLRRRLPMLARRAATLLRDLDVLEWLEAADDMLWRRARFAADAADEADAPLKRRCSLVRVAASRLERRC